MMTIFNKRYLFIRILEACNVDCFMCVFARSKDRYRFTLREFEEILPQARKLGVRFVRFTGGEPLIHKELMAMVSAGAHAGMRMSIITNASVLPKTIDRLSDAGLAQVVVSIDGAAARGHDGYRNSPGLFDKCVQGLAQARKRGVLTRVNTVVGPHNYREMPSLQRTLTAIGVRQWELSAVKLERQIVYPDPAHVTEVCDPIYEADPRTTLVPMGKRFYGNTRDEQRLFFEHSIPPRPAPPHCNLVGDVIYIDGKAGLGFGCSLLPHRSEAESKGGVRLRINGTWKLDAPGFGEHVRWFRSAGPTVCKGCSTTAGGYSDKVAGLKTVEDWEF